VSYEVVCICGQTIRGERQARHQVINCPGCGEKVFVLPRSPFTVPPDARLAASTTRRRWWLAPLLAGVVCLAALLIAFAAAWHLLIRPHEPAAEAGSEEGLAKQVEAGRSALGQGKFHLARRLLGEAVDRRDEQPGILPPAASRQLNQLHRQADLLSRLLPVSLEEIVRQGRLVRDRTEWALQMDDYRGRSVVFDDVVRRDQRGVPILATYVVEVDDEIVRLALEDLTLLRDLPLDDEPRLIFGARLHSCEREEGGEWVIRFVPDSGVLLTDPDAVAACLPGSPDRTLEQTLARQRRWLDERSVVPPGQP
jgi:DNA-directed RNA polymerase subunit RPC12/RpoP